MSKHDSTPFAGMNYEQLLAISTDSPLYDAGKWREYNRRAKLAERKLNAAHTAQAKAAKLAYEAACIMDNANPNGQYVTLTTTNPYKLVADELANSAYGRLFRIVESTRRYACRLARLTRRDIAERDLQEIGDYEANGPDREPVSP